MSVKLRIAEYFTPVPEKERASQLAKLDSFRELKQGWDSYDAEPPSEAALENARGILRHLWTRGDIIKVSLAPSVEGGVGIIFSGPGSKYADIECFNDGEILAITSEDGAEPSVWPVHAEAESLRLAIDRISSFLNG
jgi:hypothetical protein